MTVEAEDDTCKPEEDDTSRTQRPDMRPEPFKGVCSGAGFMFQRETSVGTTFYRYQDCKWELRQFFTFRDKSSLFYCNNIVGLIKSMGLWEYDAMELRLFIDLFNRNLKAVLQHNRNIQYIIGHSVQKKEIHNSMDHLLSAVNYQEQKWLICGNLLVVWLVLQVKGRYAKYNCFLCLWDSQADDQHYIREE